MQIAANTIEVRIFYDHICVILGGPTIKSPSPTKVIPEGDSSAVRKPVTTTTSVAKETQTGQVVVAESDSYSKTTQQITTESITATQEVARMSPRMTMQPKKTAQLGRNLTSTTVESSGTGKTLILSRVVVQFFIFS